MGGRALASYGSKRFSLEIYNETVNELNQKFEDFNKTIETPVSYEFPKIIPGKKDFGDIDVIVNTSLDYTSFIHSIFGDDVLFTKNANVYSVLYNSSIQIDLIFAPDNKYNNYILYYNWGGLSMILGVIARHLGFKFGINGLELRQHDLFRDVQVTNDASIIFKLLKLDISKYEKGFESVEDVYNFIWKCPYVSHEMFKIPNGKAKHRKRERDSKFYGDFLKYIQTLPQKEPSNVIPLPDTFWDRILLIRNILPTYSDGRTPFETHLEEIIINNFWNREKRKQTCFDQFRKWISRDTIQETGKLYNECMVMLKSKYGDKIFTKSTNEIKKDLIEYCGT